MLFQKAAILDDRVETGYKSKHHSLETGLYFTIVPSKPQNSHLLKATRRVVNRSRDTQGFRQGKIF